jgi:hypothetical protein
MEFDYIIDVTTKMKLQVPQSVSGHVPGHRRDWGKLLNSKLIRFSVVFYMPCTFLMLHFIPGLFIWIRFDIKQQVLSAGHWSGPKLEN